MHYPFKILLQLLDVHVPPSSPPPTAFTLSEKAIKNMLFKYLNAAIDSNIQDPVLLALSRGMRDHLSKWLFIIFYCYV